MILITRLPTGLLIQRDGAELLIDDAALPSALPTVLRTLLDSSPALAQARLSGYEAGLVVGHQTGAREAEARMQREAEQFAEGLALLQIKAPLAA